MNDLAPRLVLLSVLGIVMVGLLASLAPILGQVANAFTLAR